MLLLLWYILISIVQLYNLLSSFEYQCFLFDFSELMIHNREILLFTIWVNISVLIGHFWWVWPAHLFTLTTCSVVSYNYLIHSNIYRGFFCILSWQFWTLWLLLSQYLHLTFFSFGDINFFIIVFRFWYLKV